MRMPSKNVLLLRDCLNDYSNAAHVGNVTNNNSSESEQIRKQTQKNKEYDRGKESARENQREKNDGDKKGAQFRK